MRKNKGSSILIVLILVIVFVTNSVEAKKEHTTSHKHKTHKHKHKKHEGDHDKKPPKSDSPPSPLPPASPPLPQSTTFSVMSFGAKGDGISDDSKALVAAWEAACKVEGAKVVIPSESKFLIKPITLQGPCLPQLVLQIDGTLLAPPKVESWQKSSMFQWINFKWIHNFTIQGFGVVDGQGSNWWTSCSSNTCNTQKTTKDIPGMKPTVRLMKFSIATLAMRFYSGYNITVRDIAIINSPQCHLKFDNSKSIRVYNITVSSPEKSPNTDGIHLQNTQDVEIHHSTIGCGDDCVSIQTGCSNIHIHHINCGPGHGISVGGLGKDKSVACVSNVVVDEISMTNTLSGVRIKTWQGGIGSVKNMSFSNIQVSDVKVPIVIDQFYCDKKSSCKNHTEAVAISGVKFDGISGTYSAQPIHLACSQKIPCTDVDLTDIQLNPSPRFRGLRQALCSNSYGKSQAPLEPSNIDYCLRTTAGPVRRITRSYEHFCFPKLV